VDKEDQDDDFIDLDEIDEVISKTDYASPLLSRVASTRLTMPLLEEYIPAMKLGEEAEKMLLSGKKLNQDSVKNLKSAVRDGAKAKEILFNAALPLIRSISQKEYSRRSQWSSNIPLDDLMQDAIVGFFKGLKVYNLDSSKGSATNYLGQWMLSEMRRSAEVMDHDLQVGHDAGERYRRIKAIRSRLYNELNREPTDEEIVIASKDPNYSIKPGLVGRVAHKKTAPKGVSIEQVKEEKTVGNRLGSAIRFGEMADDDSSENGGHLDESRMGNLGIGDNDSINDFTDPAAIFESNAGSQIIAQIVEKVIINLELPEQQSEIVSRKFGLPPYEGEVSAREISRVMGIHREKISRVVNAFQAEMLKPGGTLHKLIKDIPYEDLMNLEIGWLYDSLGEWDSSYDRLEVSISEELIRPISLASDRKLKTMRAFYICDFEDRVFEITMNKGSTPLSIIDCPICKKPANLDKFTEKVD
jgi:RNA polymerase sigma factor (sigma-70 family)